jgi:antitoxin HigA-1
MSKKALQTTPPKNGMRPIHPGEILREEFLVPLTMSAHALSIALRVPAPRVNDIVRERRGVTPDTALRLSRFFGTTAQFWVALQTEYDLKVAQAEVGKQIERDVLPMAA